MLRISNAEYFRTIQCIDCEPEENIVSTASPSESHDPRVTAAREDSIRNLLREGIFIMLAASRMRNVQRW